MMRRLAWLLVIALVAFPVGYFLLHWGDYSFRIGAMGNWFGTVVGVIVGVPVGIALSKLQQKAQADEERAREQAVKRSDKLPPIIAFMMSFKTTWPWSTIWRKCSRNLLALGWISGIGPSGSRAEWNLRRIGNLTGCYCQKSVATTGQSYSLTMNSED
jgi:hypothetical protein